MAHQVNGKYTILVNGIINLFTKQLAANTSITLGTFESTFLLTYFHKMLLNLNYLELKSSTHTRHIH